MLSPIGVRDRVERTDEGHWGVGYVLAVIGDEARVEFGGPVVAWVALENLRKVQS